MRRQCMQNVFLQSLYGHELPTSPLENNHVGHSLKKLGARTAHQKGIVIYVADLGWCKHMSSCEAVLWSLV